MRRCLLTVAMATIVIPVITGCGNAPQKKARGFNEAFDTRITTNGTKLFEYRLEVPQYQLDQQRAQPRTNTAINAEGPEGRAKRMRRRLESRLETILRETGYCRDGYLEIDRSIFGGGPTMLGEGIIRGECREGATPADRRRFPNSA